MDVDDGRASSEVVTVVQKSGSPVAREAPGAGSALYVLPRHRLGWWALGLLLLTALFPAWWPVLENLIANDVLLALVTAAIAATSLGVGGVAFLGDRDRSVLVSLAFVLASVEVAVALLLVVLFSLGTDVP